VSAQCHPPLFRLRAWGKRRLIDVFSVFITVVFAFITTGPPVFTITTSLANSSITDCSICECRCDFHTSDVTHLPHLIQESVYSVDHLPLHAQYHQASGIDPEQLVNCFVQQMPTALKRGKINKAQLFRKGLPDDLQKETINREGTNEPLSIQRLVNAIAIDDRNNPSCVSMSATPPPPPPNISSSDLCRHCRHRNDGCVALRCDDGFIVGNSNTSLKGGGGKEKTLQ
jgi:hypothetical protein